MAGSAKIGSLRVDLGVSTAEFGKGLQQAGSRLSGFGALAQKAILPLVAVATAAAVGIAASVKGTINAADEMAKASQKFGVPIEELSRLAYAGKLSDVSLETLGTSLKALSKNMASAAEGTGPAADAFAALGVSVTNADGSLRSSSDVLNDLADAFKGMPDGAEKTAAAMATLGRSGTELVPLLNEGSAALAKMKAEASTFGQVFTAGMGENAQAFNDNLTRLQGAFAGLAVDLTQKLLPTLVQFTDWLVANAPRIAENIAAVVRFGASVASAANSFSDGMHLIVDTGREMTAAVQAAFTDLPARLRQVGVDAIQGLLDGLKARWESVKAWFAGLADAIPGWLRDPLGANSPSTVFAAIGRDLMAGLQGGLASMQGAVKSETESFASGLASTFASVLTGATDFREALRGILGDVGGHLIETGLSGLFKGIGVPGYAGGTQFARGGLSLVGERGPELVHMPRGSKVTPASHLGGGGDRWAHFTVDVSGARGDLELERMVVLAVAGGLRQYDAALPDRVSNIRRDPRFKGR